MDIAKPCPDCGCAQWLIGVGKIVSGATVHPWYCGSCGKRTTVYAKKEFAARWAADRGASLRVIDFKVEKRGCAVCGADGAEMHHWAPRVFFGEDADKWPMSALCVPCHTRWHQIMTPRFHRARRTER